MTGGIDMAECPVNEIKGAHVIGLVADAPVEEKEQEASEPKKKSPKK